ncbi:MAG: D-alanine--D-alanine ligase [Clostridia bacterium]|nr:D-alanine--D-alanine ligase [Clostridia bacterium]
MEKTCLGVIFGSRSCEREVAIISAVQLMHHVDQDKYQVVPVYISSRGVWYTGEKLKEIGTFQNIEERLERSEEAQMGLEEVILDTTSGSGALLAQRQGKGLFARTQEVVVSRLQVCIVVMHGLNGEDGTLQGMLEMANLPYTSTGVAGSAIGMDKIMMKQFFRGADLPVLPGEWFTRTHWRADRKEVLDRVESAIGYPVFVKPANLGSSIGVSRADGRGKLQEALDLAFEYDRRVLVEKGLDHPLEFNCSVMGYDEDVQASEIEMPLTGGEEMLSFFEKYLSSGPSKGMASLQRQLPAPIEAPLKDEIQTLSKKIFRLLDCKGVVRIDYMYDVHEGKLYITEINTIPGSLAFYLWEASGVKYRELIDRMVGYAKKAWEDRNERNYAYTSDILSKVSLGTKGSKGKFGGVK